MNRSIYSGMSKNRLFLGSLFSFFLLLSVLSCSSDVAGPDRPPVAKAGSDINAPIGTSITLDGSGSFDPDNDKIDSYAWTLNSAPEGVTSDILVSDNTATASMTPVIPGTYVVSLVVSAGGLESRPDVVRILARGCLDDEDCNDGDVCNGDETCSDGYCKEGTALDCDDAHECTIDSCDAESGCVHQNVEDGTTCGDDFCSGDKVMEHKCLGGSCTDTAVKQECDDGNPCTDDTCDSQSIQCTHTNNTASCDDTDPCSDLDQCIDGTCTAGVVNKDTDEDGFIDAACDGGDDCNDDDNGINPGSYEGPQGEDICGDGIDNDCDELTDSDDPGCGHCDQDSDCDDRNVCNGTETCSEHSCIGDSPLNCDDSNECTQDPCDPISGCSTHPPINDGTECGTSTCTGPNATILTKHVCVSGQCTETVEECDQGDECTNYFCDPGSGCSSTPNTGNICGSIECQGLQLVSHSCENGACTNTNLIEDCDDSQLCTEDSCDDTDGCSHLFAAPGTTCEEDGTGCTSDVCDDAGNCIHQEDDANCGNTELCRPTCFSGSPNGCGVPPGSLVVSCDPVQVDLSTQDNTSCTLTLADGGTITNQLPCLDCRAELKVVTLDYADFTDDDNINSCSMDGWDLRTGNHCYNNADQCPMSGNINGACCPNSNCTISGGPNDGKHAFVVNRADCSINSRKWHIRKAFNTSGLTDMELCFDYASRDATGNEVVQISVNDDNVNFNDNIFCDVGGPREQVNDVWYRQCVALPEWADDNPSVKIHIFVNSNDDDDILYLDNINLRGLSVHCPATRTVVFEENFSGCDDPMVDWNGWTVEDYIDHLACDTDDWDCFDNSKRVIAETAAASFSRTLDLTNYHDVMLCFHYGEDGASIAETLLVEYDLGYGDGWKTIWFQNGNAGVNKTCGESGERGEICVNLSELNPSFNRDPHVGLRFSMTSGTKKIELDEITVRASQYCDGQGVISFTNHASVLPDGQYEYYAQDEYPFMQASADFFCSWDTPPEGQEVQDDTSVDYLFPMP